MKKKEEKKEACIVGPQEKKSFENRESKLEAQKQMINAH